ncbi:MAG: type II secretion system F family protein, partial [Thermodesulfobacteria bacterium]|nr:type II secretion system F family protein [Thermodesulfobacteriota bacterium]
VMDGYSLSEAFKKCQFFEPFILRMIRVGEGSGHMPEQMKILANFYMEKVNRLVESIAKTMEPILIVFAGIIFVIIVMGLLGPIYDMMGSLR